MTSRLCRRFSVAILWGMVAAWASVSFAQDSAQPSYVIDAVVVEGLARTDRDVVKEALGVEVGQRATHSQLARGVQRLRDMRIFRDARFELLDQQVPLPDKGTAKTDHRILRVQVQEQWSLVPILGASFAGDLFGMTVGVVDTNAFGQGLELGGKYARLDRASSFELWASPEQVAVRGLSGHVQLGVTNRPRSLYADTGRLEGGFLRKRRLIRAGLAYDVSRHVRVGVEAAGWEDEFSTELIGADAANLQAERGLPSPNRVVEAAATVRLGRIERLGYRARGLEYRQRVAHADPVWGASERFSTVDGELAAFAVLPFRSNLAARFSYGYTGANHVEQQHFLGGFSEIRGFSDSRFRGSWFWLGNLELRVPSLQGDVVVLQHVAFMDMTCAADTAAGLRRVDAVGAGGGVRLIFPALRGFVLRADYSFPFLQSGRASFSVGVGQFF